MSMYPPTRAYVGRRLSHAVFGGTLLCLLSLAWFVGQPPAVHASGVPWCPNPLPDERAPTRPAIHLNHTEGPVGTNLTITASGWHPGARVALHLDARDPRTGELYALIPDVAQGTVAKDGAVTLPTLDAPSFFCEDIATADYTDYRFDQSGGTTAYFVLAADDGEASAPVAFAYLPAPTIAVKAGAPNWSRFKVGAAISVSGAGWEPHEPLTLTLRQSADSLAPMPYARQTHATSDAHGAFTASYPLDARLHWNTDVSLVIEGTGPNFGTLDAFADIFLMPADQPTFQADRTLVTPGMTITVSGEHWYPGDTLTIKYCDSRWGDNGWTLGPDCGKAVNPLLGVATVDAQGRMRQQFRIPNDAPLGVIMIVTDEIYTGGYGVPPIALHIVRRLPTWDDIHPRVAALRNRLVGSLPFTIPTALLLGTLAFVGVRRWRMRRAVG